MEYFDRRGDQVHPVTGGHFSALAILVLVIIGGGMWGCPQYGVYKQALDGKASLARAEEDRKILVHEAKAVKEAAIFTAQTDVIRAGGVSKSQLIINETLTPMYIQWMIADGMGDQDCDVRYIPTEAQIPILEANYEDR